MIALLFITSVFAFFASLAYTLGLLTGLAICSRGREDRSRAEEKGIALLRTWLTPEQAKQWDSHKRFDVIGSDTGTRYRVKYGAAMNIDELNSDGKVVAQWCFGPQGNLVVCDVMLAQKVALETMELEALRRANRTRW
jgi:hypothetical protein